MHVYIDVTQTKYSDWSGLIFFKAFDPYGATPCQHLVGLYKSKAFLLNDYNQIRKASFCELPKYS